MHPRTPLVALIAALALSCSGSPKPPSTSAVTPWTPAPIPRASAPSASGSTTVSAAPRRTSPYTLEQLLGVRRAVSPRAIAGGGFAYLSDASGTYQLHVRRPGKPDLARTAFTDRVADLRVDLAGKRAVILRDNGGDENFELLLVDLEHDDAIARPLTHAPKVRHTLPVFDDAGGRIAFTSNERDGKNLDLYVMALPKAGEPSRPAPDLAPSKDGKRPPVAPPSPPHRMAPFLQLEGSNAVVDWVGDRILVSQSTSNVDGNLYLVDVKTKKSILLTHHTGDERWEQARLSADGQRIYALTDRDSEHMHLVAVEVGGAHRVTTLFGAERDLDGFALPHRAPEKPGKTSANVPALIAVNVGGDHELWALTLAGAEVVAQRPTTVRAVISSMDIAPAGDVAWVAFERSRSAPEVHRLELGTGAVTKATESDHQGVDESMFVDAQLLTMKASDGVPISTWWYAPKTEPGEKLPVVVWVHGGPESQERPIWAGLFQYLVLSGYAVAAPNVRGSTGYGKSFTHLDDKEKRQDSVRDLHEIAEMLAGRPEVDGRRMALIGGSYGGYMVLAGLTLYPAQWAAGVDIVGIANFRTFLEHTAEYRRALREAEYGSLATDGALLDRISPIHSIDKIAAPLMVIHGARDPRVPIDEARQVVAALEKRGLPVSLLTYEDEGHGLAKLKNRLDAYPKMVSFIDQYVKERPPAAATSR
jgi:dienelactone hydrolase